jgi:hypothetical protein
MSPTGISYSSVQLVSNERWEVAQVIEMLNGNPIPDLADGSGRPAPHRQKSDLAQRAVGACTPRLARVAAC